MQDKKMPQVIRAKGLVNVKASRLSRSDRRPMRAREGLVLTRRAVQGRDTVIINQEIAVVVTRTSPSEVKLKFVSLTDTKHDIYREEVIKRRETK